MRILIIDDDRWVHRLIEEELKSQGYCTDKIIHAYSGHEGVEKFISHKPKFVLLDMLMPGIDGFETYKLMKDHNPDAKVILMTGYDADAGTHAAISAGIDGYISKNNSGYIKMVVSLIISMLNFEE